MMSGPTTAVVRPAETVCSRTTWAVLPKADSELSPHTRPGGSRRRRRKRAQLEIMRSLILCLLMVAAPVAQQAQEGATVFRADTRIVVCHTTVIEIGRAHV